MSSGYPTAYRPASRAYAGSQAFRGSQGGSPQPGPSRLERLLSAGYDQVLDYISPGNVIEDAIRGAGYLQDEARAAKVAKPPLTIEHESLNKQAFRRVWQRAARITPAYRMYATMRAALELYQGWSTIPSAEGVPSGWTECYPPCRPIDAYAGSKVSNCIGSVCGSGIYELTPGIDPGDTHIYGLANQHEIGPPFWLIAGQWIAGSEGLPYADWPSGFRWNGITITGFPELDPIMKPRLGPPVPPPYTAIPSVPQSQYHISGPPPPGGKPPVITDTHMPPLPDVQERKPDNKAKKAVAYVINVATESSDALGCIHDALPDGDKVEVKGRKYGGDTIYYWNPSWAKKKGYTDAQISHHNLMYKLGRKVHQTPQTMVMEILASAAKAGDSDPRAWAIDVMSKTISCLAQNEVLDQAIGRSMQAAQSNLVSSVKSAGGSPNWISLGRGSAL